MPKLSEALFGKKAKNKQVSTLSPEQNELMKLILEGITTGEGNLGELFGGFNEEQFNKGVTEPALKNFKENILPALQEKFIAGNQVGGSGQVRGFEKAGSDLQSMLAQLMYQAQQGQKGNQIAGINQALGVRPFENIQKTGTTGVIPGLLQGTVAKGGPILGNAAESGFSALKGIIAG